MYGTPHNFTVSHAAWFSSPLLYRVVKSVTVLSSTLFKSLIISFLSENLDVHFKIVTSLLKFNLLYFALFYSMVSQSHFSCKSLLFLFNSPYPFHLLYPLLCNQLNLPSTVHLFMSVFPTILYFIVLCCAVLYCAVQYYILF